MRATLNLPPSVRLIEAGLEGLVQVNRVLIETGVVPPSPLDTRVRYKRERSGLEEWDNALVCMKRGWGDCEDLNSWECARINIEEDEWAVCSLIQTGPKIFHCIIVMSDGSRRDVCPDLGMKVPGTNLEGIPWVDTREENILGATPAQTARQLRRLAMRSLNLPKRRYRPTSSSPAKATSSRSGKAYEPKASRPRDPTTEPETMEPGAETATQMVSPTSAQSPAMDNMPMPMMDQADDLEAFESEPEAFDEVLEEEGGAEEGDEA
jgi:hypothetical protein